MADLNHNIRQGIYTLLVGASNAFRTQVSVTVGQSTFYKLYELHKGAPYLIPGTSTVLTAPYVVFGNISMSETRDSAVTLTTATVQFSAYALTLSDAETLISNIRAIVDNSERSLSVTGATVLRVDFSSQVNVPSEEYFSIAITYTLTLQD